MGERSITDEFQDLLSRVQKQEKDLLEREKNAHAEWERIQAESTKLQNLRDEITANLQQLQALRDELVERSERAEAVQAQIAALQQQQQPRQQQRQEVEGSRYNDAPAQLAGEPPTIDIGLQGNTGHDAHMSPLHVHPQQEQGLDAFQQQQPRQPLPPPPPLPDAVPAVQPSSQPWEAYEPQYVHPPSAEGTHPYYHQHQYQQLYQHYSQQPYQQQWGYYQGPWADGSFPNTYEAQDQSGRQPQPQPVHASQQQGGQSQGQGQGSKKKKYQAWSYIEDLADAYDPGSDFMRSLRAGYTAAKRLGKSHSPAAGGCSPSKAAKKVERNPNRQQQQQLREKAAKTNKQKNIKTNHPGKEEGLPGPAPLPVGEKRKRGPDEHQQQQAQQGARKWKEVVPRTRAGKLVQPCKNVYVGNLDHLTSREEVRDFFSKKCGPADVTPIFTKYVAVNPHRYCFVEFLNIKDAEKAVALDGHLLNSQKMDIQYSAKDQKTRGSGPSDGPSGAPRVGPADAEKEAGAAPKISKLQPQRRQQPSNGASHEADGLTPPTHTNAGTPPNRNGTTRPTAPATALGQHGNVHNPTVLHTNGRYTAPGSNALQDNATSSSDDDDVEMDEDFDDDGNNMSPWDENLIHLTEFEMEYKRLPTPSEKFQEVALGAWCERQQMEYARGRLRDDRRLALQRVPGWIWRQPPPLVINVNELRFSDWLDLLKRFVAKKKRLPRAAEVYKGRALGSWCARQRTAYKKDELVIHRVQALDAIEEWTWHMKGGPKSGGGPGNP